MNATAPQPAAARPPLTRERWRLPVSELGVMLISAAVGAGLVRAFVQAAGLDARSAEASGVGPVWAAVMIAIGATAVAVQRRAGGPGARLTVAALAGAAAALVMLPLMVGLHGTDQPPYTISGGDMEFRTEYVTRLATSWGLHDYSFRGLPAFYPPAWFWLAGHTADVLGIAPWRIVAPFTIATIGVALAVAYLLWRCVLSPAGALAAAIGSSLVLPTQVGPLPFVTQGWYSAYSCFVALTGVAWVAAMFVTVRRGSRERLAVLAVVGAVLALTYYLLFVLLLAVLVVLLATRRVGRADAMRRLGAVVGAIALLTAVFWIPFLTTLVGGSASQGHFVSPTFLTVAVGLDGPPALTLLVALVIAALALAFGASASRAVAGVIVGAVLYQLLSVVTLVFLHQQLQPHRAVTLMWAAYGAALPVALDGEPLRQWLPPRVVRPAVAAIAAVGVGATYALGSATGSDLVAGPLTQAAYSRPNIAQADAMSRFITAAAGRKPQQLTIVSGEHTLLVTKPYFSFLPLRARYANPKADVPARVTVLRAAAACPDGACTASRLAGSRFGPIDALVLGRTPQGYRIDAELDGFPDPKPVVVLFRPSQFDPLRWAARDFGPYRVFVRRAG